jgi:hypothetical protein
MHSAATAAAAKQCKSSFPTKHVRSSQLLHGSIILRFEIPRRSQKGSNKRWISKRSNPLKFLQIGCLIEAYNWRWHGCGTSMDHPRRKSINVPPHIQYGFFKYIFMALWIMYASLQHPLNFREKNIFFSNRWRHMFLWPCLQTLELIL